MKFGCSTCRKPNGPSKSQSNGLANNGCVLVLRRAYRQLCGLSPTLTLINATRGQRHKQLHVVCSLMLLLIVQLTVQTTEILTYK